MLLHPIGDNAYIPAQNISNITGTSFLFVGFDYKIMNTLKILHKNYVILIMVNFLQYNM